MSEMVKRVARAIRVARQSDPDTPPQEPQAGELEWWIPEARAAIEAMREPTEAMQRAWEGPESWGWGPLKVYRAMIDAALRD